MSGMKGLDTFIGSLIAIFIIFVLLLAASTFFPYYPEGTGGGGTGGSVIHKSTGGNIGYTENYVSRVQNLGSFGVGIPQKELLKSAPRMEISAWLFGSTGESFTITVPESVLEFLKGGEIVFTVEDTNQYGNLIMNWNGAAVFSESPGKGKQAVAIGASRIKASNSLEIVTQGPGLLFWATTVYKITDFKVSAEYGPAKISEFTVSQDELESLNRFELDWYTASRTGTLVVKVNGDELFNSYPEREQKLEFTDSSLRTAAIRAGTNRLTFIAINGSFELQDVTLKTYLSRSQRTLKERFEITDAQLASLRSRGGVVKVYVEGIDRAGELRVRLNEQSAGSVQAKAGWNSVQFQGSLVETGSNWLEISGTGTFDAGEVSVEIA